MEPKDCRIIQGDAAVIISKTTANEALSIMRERAAQTNNWERLFADDRSFMIAALRELEKAAE